METIPIYVGYDPREAAAYTAFCQSVIDTTSVPVAFHPLCQNTLGIDGQQDGTNQFIYSRYLVPHLQDYEGWAIFVDGDMVCLSDIKELWDERDDYFAVKVVKHDYLSGYIKKYIGSPLEAENIDYPRKNWSSVMLINCGHPSNKILTKEFVSEAGGAVLHRFGWLTDREVGTLPSNWNHLALEYDPDPQAKLIHYTLGIPAFSHYARTDYHREWNEALTRALNVEGERADEIVRRAAWRRRAA